MTGYLRALFCLHTIGRRGARSWSLVLLMGLSIALPVKAAEQIIKPVASGTIADGGTHGPFGGGPDAADWFFNESSFEGAITLVLEPPPALEQRDSTPVTPECV